MVLIAAVALSACSPRKFVRGYIADKNLVESIRPRVDTRSSVKSVLGSPTAESTFDQSSWYYYSKKSEQFAFFSEKVTELDILAVRFDEDGYVTKMDRYTLADGKLIDPVSKKTITHGKEQSLFDDLFGNIGRFGAGGGVPQAGN